MIFSVPVVWLDSSEVGGTMAWVICSGVVSGLGWSKALESPICSEPAASIWVSMTPMVWIAGLRGSRLCREILVFGRLRARRGILKGFKE